MTIHFRPIPKPVRKRCDTRALEATRVDTHRRLRDELEEQRISAILIDKHNRHLRDSQQYKQQGGA